MGAGDHQVGREDGLNLDTLGGLFGSLHATGPRRQGWLAKLECPDEFEMVGRDRLELSTKGL